MRDRRLVGPAQVVRRLQAFERGRERRRRGVDRKLGAVDAAKLGDVREHVHELLRRRRNVEQRVALRRHLAEPAADQDDEVGALHPRQQLGIGADAEVARIARVVGVEQVRAAERRRNRKCKTLGEALHRRAGGLRPAAAAEQHDRPLRRPDHLLQPAHVGQARPGLDRLERRRIVDRDALGQHVLGQRDHHRAGAAAGRGVIGARDDLGDARRIVDLGRPLGDGAEHRAVVELLERLALAHVARDLADEQDHRRGILPGDVHAGRRVGGAGPAGDEADAGPAGGLADRLRHHGGAALVPADGDGEVAAVAGVERRDVALARHAEHVARAVDDELVDQDFAAGPQVVTRAHDVSDSLQSRGILRRHRRTCPGDPRRPGARQQRRGCPAQGRA